MEIRLIKIMYRIVMTDYKRGRRKGGRQVKIEEGKWSG